MGLPRVMPIAITARGPNRPDIPAAVDLVILPDAVSNGAFRANRTRLAEEPLWLLILKYKKVVTELHAGISNVNCGGGLTS